MTLLQLSILVAGILNFFLGLIVLKRNIKNPVNFSFAIFAIPTSIWAIVNFFLIYEPSLLMLRFAYATGVFVVANGLSWVLILTGQKRKKYILTPYFLGITFFILGTTPLIVKDLIKFSTTGSQIVYGPVFYIYGFFMLLGTIILLSELLFHSAHSKGYQKSQLRFVFLGALIFCFTSIVGSFMLPIFGINKFIMWDSPSSLFFIAFSTYAIVKHRLMDIRMVVARSVAYSILIAIMAGLYAGAVIGIETIFFPDVVSQFNWTVGIIRTILAVIMAFSFQPLRRWITKATDKIFFKNQYDANEFLDTLSHTIGATIVLVELIYKTLGLIREQIKVSRGIMVILAENNLVYNTQNFGYGKPIRPDAKDMEKMCKDGILIYDELEETSHYKHLLKKYDASVAIPLKTENTVEGVLILGEKLSGDMCGAQDLKVFEIIAPELAVAITNAKAFEKIEKFNVTLRQEVKKATSELEKKNEQLRELDKAKDEFISMASHQLRTPLTAIKGYLSMLLEGDAGEIKVSQYDFVNEAFSGANRMVGLINDLLNVSRMETGRFFLEPVETDMEKVVTEEVKQLENHAKEKGLSLKYAPKGKIPHIWVDETKIRQVVMNFIDNALYYTNQGGVTITLEKEKESVVFKVTDTGIGVPRAAQKSLFTKFYRADNARHVRPDGTGLGIYLAKRVMDDHGGEIIFHSKEGEGSTFGFKMPIKSKLKIKRISAPLPENAGSPAVGELAAGVGVKPEEVEKTESK